LQSDEANWSDSTLQEKDFKKVKTEKEVLVAKLRVFNGPLPCRWSATAMTAAAPTKLLAGRARHLSQHTVVGDMADPKELVPAYLWHRKQK
jgi:hypothetical protein